MYLGVIRAEAELQQMYSSETNARPRRQIIHAMMASQSAKGLVEIARKKPTRSSKARGGSDAFQYENKGSN